MGYEPLPVPAPLPTLESEAVRLFRRYEVEIVQELKLCPWAERSRLDGRVQERVLLSREPDQAPALEAISSLESDPRLEIGLLLFPRLEVTQPEHERFVSCLVDADAARRELGTAPFAMAAFHPDARADLSNPERLVPFLRRTPDPTIQLVRVSVLDRVREGFNEGTQFVDLRALSSLGAAREETLPLRERIARGNLKMVRRVGPDEVERRLLEIRKDRDATYARLRDVARVGRAD